MDFSPLTRLPDPLQARMRRCRAILRGHRVAVAFSGGVDSAVLLALAVAELGADSVVAVLGVSDSLADDERTAAHQVAAQIGVPVTEVLTSEMSREAYRANGPDRCYFCKDELFTRMQEVADTLGVEVLAYGENADDATRVDRPGARAATEHRVLRPLAAAGLTKDGVREIARALGLQCADKPAAPCLASRIPHFSPVLPDKLRAVGAAERLVRDLGFSDCRVRHHGELARLELPEADLARALDPGLRQALLAGISACGFRHVTIDLAGMQSGAFTLSVLQASGATHA